MIATDNGGLHMIINYINSWFIGNMFINYMRVNYMNILNDN